MKSEPYTTDFDDGGVTGMFEYIRGTFQGINKDYVIIENHGIGYRIFTSGSTMAEMPKLKEDTLLYVEQIVREDFIGLYGFVTKEELQMFNLLLTINGVGPKAALSLLSLSSVSQLKRAIISKDEKTLTKAPGIGKKIAQRIILELMDKINAGEAAAHEEQNAGTFIEEALAALLALGYSEKEAGEVLGKVNKEDTLEGIIKQSLKHLMK